MTELVSLIVAALGSGTLATIVTTILVNRRGMSADLFTQLSERLNVVEAAEEKCQERYIILMATVAAQASEIATLKERLARNSNVSVTIKRIALSPQKMEQWADQIHETLAKDKPSMLCIDLANMSMLPSASIAEIVRATKMDTMVILENSSASLRDGLIVLGLDKLGTDKLMF